jgi:GH24 family phage-related lysozyme (muramidase)
MMYRPTDLAVIDLAIEIIQQLEGWRPRAYQDSAGVWTIGWGRTVGVEPTSVTTEVDELPWLRRRVEACARAIAARVPADLRLPRECWAALISWTYNVVDPTLPPKLLEQTQWWRSKLWSRLETGAYDLVDDVLVEWVKIRDPKTNKLRVLRGLIERRQREAELWNQGLMRRRASVADVSSDGTGAVEGEKAVDVFRTDTMRGSTVATATTAATSAVAAIAPQLFGLDWRVAVAIIFAVAVIVLVGVYFWRAQRS